MGNRCVITTKYDLEKDGIGIYLHWNGGRDSVEAFLEYCKRKSYRSPDKDSYGYASLVNVVTNFFGNGMSVALDKLTNLDCDNGDNGVYIIEDWAIVDRKYFDGIEQHEYDLEEFIKDIDNQMPEHMRMYGNTEDGKEEV